MENPATDQQQKTLKERILSKSFLKAAAGTVIGGVAGYLYYHYVGCASGSCAITSNPYMSVIFGSAMGFYATNSPCNSNRC